MIRPARLLLAASALATLGSQSGRAWAGDEPPESSGPNDKQAAEDAYQQALSLYQAGDLKSALSRMQESYRLSNRPELLYNIARIESELGDCQASLANFRQYVERVPQGRYREPAEAASRELALQCPPPEPGPASAPEAPLAAPAAPAAAPPPVVAEPAHEPPPGGSTYWTTPRWIGWSAITTGTLAGIGAVYFTVAALDSRNQYEKSIDGYVKHGTPVDLSLEDDQHRHQRWAQALAFASGALLASGTLMLVLAPGPSTGTKTTAAVFVQPDLVGARFSTSF